MRALVHPSEREEIMELKRLFDRDVPQEIDFTDKVMNQIHTRSLTNPKYNSKLQHLRSFKGIALAVLFIALISSSAFATYEKSVSLKDKDGNYLLNLVPGKGEMRETVPEHSEFMDTYRASMLPGESVSIVFGNKEEAIKEISTPMYFVEKPYKVVDLGNFPLLTKSPLNSYLYPNKKVLKYSFDHALIYLKMDRTDMVQPFSKRLDFFTFTVSESGMEYGYKKNHMLEDISSVKLIYVNGNKEISYKISYSEPTRFGPTVHVYGPMGTLHMVNEIETYYVESDKENFRSITWVERNNNWDYKHNIVSQQVTKKELLTFAKEIIGK